MYKKSVTESDYKRLSALAAAVRGGPRPDRARLLESGLKDALLFRGEDITRGRRIPTTWCFRRMRI
jgi:hypothetical protein